MLILMLIGMVMVTDAHSETKNLISSWSSKENIRKYKDHLCEILAQYIVSPQTPTPRLGSSCLGVSSIGSSCDSSFGLSCLDSSCICSSNSTSGSTSSLHSTAGRTSSEPSSAMRRMNS